MDLHPNENLEIHPFTLDELDEAGNGKKKPADPATTVANTFTTSYPFFEKKMPKNPVLPVVQLAAPFQVVRD